ncbi:conserved membrane hypothetical protein [Vibrio chagasii]|nr:conserved membrane hypothetical protein [Vibrio chagasii]CAH6936578.1 conserved membrane hypothetical protein [Vibrio chagasii]CAH7086853.1 conserved membrane hypothetical protein [Vibrio chagasii]CAH7127512.1 conserved membrane hypothetical protein [Vibrio chagasii]
MNLELVCLFLVLVSLMLPSLTFLNFKIDNKFLGDLKPERASQKKLRASDICAIVFLFVSFVIYTINLYIPLEYRHSDSVGYLNSIIKPVLYSGRFFPLGHQEFNIVTLDDFGFVGLFSIPFIQSVIAIFIIYKIIPLRSVGIRTLLIVAIFLSSLSISFSNLIIPERNQIFFILLFLYFSFNSKESWKIKLGLLFASISLYYKEPTFLIYLSFSIALVLVRLVRKDFELRELTRFSFWLDSLRFELYLLFISLLFVISYIIIFNLQEPSSLYEQSSGYQEYISRVFGFSGLYHYPFVLLSFILLLYFCINGLKTRYSEQAFVFYCGANAYALGMFALKMPTDVYYFNAANLLILLSASYLVVEFFEERKNKTLLFFIIFSVFSIFVVQTSLISVGSLRISKSKQIGLSVISSYLNNISESNRLIIYYDLKDGDYPDYSSSVMSLYLRTKISNEFTLYTKSGCYVWHESNENGFYECRKKEFYIQDDYDFIISNKGDSELPLKERYQKYESALVKSDDMSVYFKNGKD